MQRSIVVCAYDPGWPRVFEALHARLWPAVQDIALAIEHVGSTAVPGLAAKPIIDVDIIVPPDRVGDGIVRLAALGYTHRGDLGIPGREAFHRPPESPAHHLYLCPQGSAALANHLAVRDHLRAHPAVARAYGELKIRLAAEFGDDMDGYIEAKTAFLAEVLRGAGFSGGEVGEIERRNRRPGT